MCRGKNVTTAYNSKLAPAALLRFKTANNSSTLLKKSSENRQGNERNRNYWDKMKRFSATHIRIHMCKLRHTLGKVWTLTDRIICIPLCSSPPFPPLTRQGKFGTQVDTYNNFFSLARTRQWKRCCSRNQSRHIDPPWEKKEEWIEKKICREVVKKICPLQTRRRVKIDIEI